eukprot:TRINITY_DN1987_c0_g1_i2.p1 TRINITY_DN1987_c0_g1~~TRINITY_DN1987_c0_g1_i2.p1  ORF type:complete len:147 (+),score=4.40 TRINITY_DN1987_c0_g1_i2:30-470(+)
MKTTKKQYVTMSAKNKRLEKKQSASSTDHFTNLLSQVKSASWVIVSHLGPTGKVSYKHPNLAGISYPSGSRQPYNFIWARLMIVNTGPSKHNINISASAEPAIEHLSRKNGNFISINFTQPSASLALFGLGQCTSARRSLRTDKAG